MENITAREGVLREFRALCAIPHPSGHEEKISDYLMKTLTEMGLRPRRDAIYNVCCDVPATPGYGRQGRLCLQAHSDMVCVGAADYRPAEDPIHCREADGWLKTDGRSSLGADCGIGLAAALYLIRSGAPHGPLRLLFTADEERGLAGAQALSPEVFDGCDGLINLDGFHFGRLLISSAGGLRQTFQKSPELFFPMLGRAARLEITGLRGGHSGDDIGLGRGNAAQLMVWLLQSLSFPYELGSISAGTAHNAIPTSASAVITLEEQDEDALRTAAEAFLAGLREIYGTADPDIAVSVTRAERPQWVLTVDQRDDLLALAGLIQCGPESMHPLCPTVVGSSGSMGRLHADDTGLEVMSFLRSRDEAEMQAKGDFYAMAAEGFGFSAWRHGYPAWPGVESDPLTDCAMSIAKELGIPAEKSAVHVGLEPSVFYALRPELPMVSMGMDIEDPHSVSERVRLGTIGPFFALLSGIAEKYGQA